MDSSDKDKNTEANDENWQLEKQRYEKLLEAYRRELSTLREEVALTRRSFPRRVMSRLGSLFSRTEQQYIQKAVATPEQVELIRNSDLFDPTWYLQSYSDIANSDWSERPIEHYLKFGVLENRNPGPNFDTGWYLSQYPDVKASGINPLVHYLLHGHAEERAPVKPNVERMGISAVSRVDFFNRKLWTGFSDHALDALKQLTETGSKNSSARAFWYLARWQFAHGDYEAALELLENMMATQDKLTRRLVVGLGKCHAQLQDGDAMQALLDEPAYVDMMGKALRYLQANAYFAQNQTEAGLQSINTLFWAHGLQGITLADSTKPLTIENLRGEHNLAFSLGTQENLPLVSVVIPAYNAADTIHIALDSLLAQTWPNLEIIVVDDCSSDNTFEVLSRYEQEFPNRVRVFKNEVNRGAYPTRNFGMQQAQGDFLTVHDSDDWSHPQKIEKQALLLLNNSSKMASLSNWVRVKEDMRFVGSWYLNEVFIEKNHSSALIRRQVVEQTGYWDPVNVGGDTEFLWRVEQYYGDDAVSTVLPDVPLSFALALDDSLTRTKATHVKTIHYGLRRLYREAARWWHKHNEKPVFKAGDSVTERPFPVPIGNLRSSPSEFDTALVADFTTENKHLSDLLAKISELSGTEDRLVLCHWPDYRNWDGAHIADEVFDLCMQHGVQFCHQGQAISCKNMHFVNAALWEKPPSLLPVIKGIEDVIVWKPSGEEATEDLRQGLSSIFAAGGTTE